MNVLCALKLTELWNTSLLFDLNYKFELIGASLLALAKSIYYTSFLLKKFTAKTVEEDSVACKRWISRKEI